MTEVPIDTIKRLLTETLEELPAPRLQLVWGESQPIEGDPRVQTICYYVMVFPVEQYDVRNLNQDDEGLSQEPGFAFAWLGHTTCTGVVSDPLETPFRDGAHIKWDSKSLSLPAFVSRGKQWRKL